MIDQEIRVHQQSLLRRHPELSAIQFISLDQLAISANNLSAFIERTWTDDYQDEPRICFDDAFFAHNALDSAISIGAIKEHALVGLFLALPISNRANSTGVIATALTVSKDSRGLGIAQMLYLKQLEGIRKKGYNFVVYWLDARHADPGSSHDIFSNKGYPLKRKRVPIYCKIIDRNQAASFHLINPWENGATAAIQALIGLAGHQKAPAITAQAHNRTVLSPVHHDSRIHLSSRAFDNIESCGAYRIHLVLEHEGQIRGTLFGFLNAYRGSTYCQVDGVHFAAGVPYLDKLRFIRTCEDNLNSHYGCFMIIIPRSVSSENLLTFGYIPFVSQIMATHVFKQDLELTAQFIYLR